MMKNQSTYAMRPAKFMGEKSLKTNLGLRKLWRLLVQYCSLKTYSTSVTSQAIPCLAAQSGWGLSM